MEVGTGVSAGGMGIECVYVVESIHHAEPEPGGCRGGGRGVSRGGCRGGGRGVSIGR